MNINIFHFSDLSSTAFILPMQTIDVWFFKTEDFPPDAQDTQILSTEERNRIAGYSQVKDRIQHQTARFLLRLLLGKYLHIAPEELVLRTGTHGKLYLDYDALTVRGLGHLPRLSFNLSHSEEQIAFAFSFSSPVGIDIEKYVKMHAAATLSTVSFTRMKNCDSHIYRSGKVHSFFSVTGRYEKHF